MRYILAALAFIALAFSAPLVIAGAQPNHTHTVSNDVVEHGGGCRKSSPAGQCCHAGSQPYHCH